MEIGRRLHDRFLAGLAIRDREPDPRTDADDEHECGEQLEEQHDDFLYYAAVYLNLKTVSPMMAAVESDKAIGRHSASVTMLPAVNCISVASAPTAINKAAQRLFKNDPARD